MIADKEQGGISIESDVSLSLSPISGVGGCWWGGGGLDFSVGRLHRVSGHLGLIHSTLISLNCF